MQIYADLCSMCQFLENSWDITSTAWCLADAKPLSIRPISRMHCSRASSRTSPTQGHRVGTGPQVVTGRHRSPQGVTGRHRSSEAQGFTGRFHKWLQESCHIWKKKCKKRRKNDIEIIRKNPPTPLWRWRRAYWGANSRGGQKRFRTETRIRWCLRDCSTIFGCLSLRG